MKTFIYTISKETKSRNGGRTVTASVYSIIKNEPKLVGEVKWQPASYKGEESCVMNFLGEMGVIPTKFKDGYYMSFDNKDFKIIKL